MSRFWWALDEVLRCKVRWVCDRNERAIWAGFDHVEQVRMVNVPDEDLDW